MIKASNFINYKPRINIADIYPHHLILIEKLGGLIQLFHTEKPSYNEIHPTMWLYMKHHGVQDNLNIFHWLNFKEITEEIIGKKIIERYPTIQRIFIQNILLKSIYYDFKVTKKSKPLNI